jgi:hypothetical protein
VDGEGPTPVTRFDGDFGPLAYLDATLAALPHRLLDRPGACSCWAWAAARTCCSPCATGARRWTWSSPDGNVADLLRGELAGFAGRILDRPEVRLHVDAARRFAEASEEAEYDLIRLEPRAGGGRSTLAENFTTTVEAFTAYLRRLAPGGLLALPHPLRLPPRESLKLALTAMEALEGLGAAEPARHLALVRAWDGVLLLVRRTPFGAQDLAAVEAFAEEFAFDLGWHPAMPREAADRFNLLGEPVFFDGVAALAGPGRAAFVATTPSTSAPRRTTGPTSSTSSAGARCPRSGRRRAGATRACSTGAGRCSSRRSASPPSSAWP